MPKSNDGAGGKTAEKRQPPSTQRAAPLGQTMSSQGPGPETQSLPSGGLLGSDFSQSTFERHAALLGDPRMSHPMYSTKRAAIAKQLQRDYGNRYVQRLVEHIQRRRGEVVQAKLKVGPAGDRYEQEADRVAKEVMGAIAPPGPEPPLRQMPGEAIERKPVQRQIGAEGGDAGPEVEQAIQKARGGGQSLPSNVRSPMEGAFGADFSGVKVHADAQADSLNDSMSSVAFTTGQDIFFREGDYSPGSSAGQELLAHELTHVVQQGGAAVRRENGVALPETTNQGAGGEPDDQLALPETTSDIGEPDPQAEAQGSKIASLAKKIFKKLEPDPKTNKFRLLLEGAGHIAAGILLATANLAAVAAGAIPASLLAALLAIGQVLIGS